MDHVVDEEDAVPSPVVPRELLQGHAHVHPLVGLPVAPPLQDPRLHPHRLRHRPRRPRAGSRAGPPAPRPAAASRWAPTYSSQTLRFPLITRVTPPDTGPVPGHEPSPRPALDGQTEAGGGSRPRGPRAELPARCSSATGRDAARSSEWHQPHAPRNVSPGLTADPRGRGSAWASTSTLNPSSVPSRTPCPWRVGLPVHPCRGCCGLWVPMAYIVPGTEWGWAVLWGDG